MLCFISIIAFLKHSTTVKSMILCPELPITPQNEIRSCSFDLYELTALVQDKGDIVFVNHSTVQDMNLDLDLDLVQDKGDIAFVKHSTVKDMNLDSNQFELLCLDGQR